MWPFLIRQVLCTSGATTIMPASTVRLKSGRTACVTDRSARGYKCLAQRTVKLCDLAPLRLFDLLSALLLRSVEIWLLDLNFASFILYCSIAMAPRLTQVKRLSIVIGISTCFFAIEISGTKDILT